MFSEDTIISTITPVRGGSVCLLRVSGKDAINITCKYFKSNSLSNMEGGRFYFGKFVDDKNEVVDEVIIYVFKKPKSYTGEDVIEISCHSNIFILEEIINLYLNNNCRIAEPGEFTKRAFLNNKIDLVQAEAVADLIASKSKASVKNSLNLLEGKLSKLINSLKKNLIDVGSLLELELDFSEEDLEIISRDKFFDIMESSISIVNSLLDSYDSGRELQKGIEILIAGKPNVGKSSLMNSLLQKDRVIVSHIAGTTRDLIHEDIVMDDTLVRLIDTAGIRFTSDEIEAEGVTRAKKFLETASLILLMIDLSSEIDNDDLDILNSLVHKKSNSLIIVGNKSDKEVNIKTEEYLSKLEIDKIKISAKEETNISELKRLIIRRIKRNEKDLSEDIILTNKRQYDVLNRLKKILNDNLKSFKSNQGFEFIAVDLRLAIETLSEITGEISTDDILNNIFSNFCIGK